MGHLARAQPRGFNHSLRMILPFGGLCGTPIEFQWSVHASFMAACSNGGWKQGWAPRGGRTMRLRSGISWLLEGMLLPYSPHPACGTDRPCQCNDPATTPFTHWRSVEPASFQYTSQSCLLRSHIVIQGHGKAIAGSLTSVVASGALTVLGEGELESPGLHKLPVHHLVSSVSCFACLIPDL